MNTYIRRENATILITALWVLAILTVFAVSVGRQSAISLKLTSYNIDRLKAYYIARAAILRGLSEKVQEYSSGRSVTIDALSERWANNRKLFDHSPFGDGTYTLGYEYLESESVNEKLYLYGLMDEQSKININTAPKEALANLLESFEIDRNEAEEMAAAIIDWRDEDNIITTSTQGNYFGAEDEYYQELSPPYHCKNLPFDIIHEILLVRGFTPELFSKIKDYITVYGYGKVNINTASLKTLNAIFGSDFPHLASKIVRFRQGNDELIGTRDDRWFSIGPYIIDRKEEGLLEIKNLLEPTWYGNMYGISTEEYNRIRQLITKQDLVLLCASSMTYRAITEARVRRVKVRIEAVYLFEERGISPNLKFWYQE